LSSVLRAVCILQGRHVCERLADHSKTL
jgi:hypothetical protein